MWFFMILSYILIALSGIGLALIGINHYFHFIPQNHITLDLLVSLIFVAAQTLVIFFFVGTGVNIKEYIKNEKIENSFYSQILAVKHRLYPPTMMLLVLFVALVIVDGVFFIRKISDFWFGGLYVLTLYYYIKATIVQHKSFQQSTEIILKMTGVNVSKKEKNGH